MKIKDVIKEEVNDFILNEVENELGKMINETTYKVYHGTNEKFNTFDPNKTADGTIWFTDNVDSIKNGEHGGDGNKYIMTRHITLNNPAGWDEYEKYSIGELEDMGYDGVILPEDNKNDFIVFSTKSISSRPNGLGESIIKETTYKVYHGTNEKFGKFNFNKTNQGVIWFTDSIDSIKNNEHGGRGSKYIMTRYITINKPAGWNEYQKYGLGQLRGLGYDGVILPQEGKTDYFVFSNKNINANPNGVTETSNTEVEYDGNQDDSSPVLPNFGDRLNIK